MSNKPIGTYYRKAYQDFSGGLNTFNSVTTVKQNEFVQLDNALINNRKLLEKYKGYTVDGSPFPDDVDSFIRMLVNYKRGTTVDKLVVAALDETNANATYKVDLKETSGDGTYSYFGYSTGTATFTNGSANVTAGAGTAFTTHLKTGDKIKPAGTSVWYDILSVTGAGTLTLLTTFGETTQTTSAFTVRIMLHKDFIPRAIVFNNNLVISNGSESMMTYNNTSVTLITDADAPKGRFLEPHKSRVFSACFPALPSSIGWSAVNDETAWDATSTEPIFPQDGGNICGIRSFADSLFVFKDNGNIYQVIGSFDQSVAGEVNYIKRIDTPDNIGTIAGYTAVVHDDNRLYFLSETGIYSIDTSGRINKESQNINTEANDIVIRPGVQSSKSFVYDSSTQFNTGTKSGTRTVSTEGTVKPYFDIFTINGAQVNKLGAAVAIDSSLDVHVAYIDSTDNKKIIYKKYLALDNSLSINETAVTETTDDIKSLSIDVAAGGNVGIGYKLTSSGASFAVAKFAERSSGVWAAVSLHTEINASNDSLGISFKYQTSGTDGYCGFTHANSADGRGVSVARRVSGVWSIVTVENGEVYYELSLTVNSGNHPRFISRTSAGILNYFESANSGASYSTVDTLALSWGDLAETGLELTINSTGQGISAFVDSSNTLKKRNHSTTTTSTVDSTSTCRFKGHTLNATNQDNAYCSVVPSSLRVEKFTFENSATITNTVENTKTTVCSDRMLVRNGVTFASIAYGANANELIVRRLAYRSTWIKPEDSDSTLSAWGTYVVTDQIDNSATITHEIALNSVSPASSYTAITSGSTISTNAALVYSLVRITFVLGGFAEPSVGSVTLNYTGAGVNAILPSAVVFDNEIYLSYAFPTDTANEALYLFDLDRAWSNIQYPVTFMCRYKDNLYGGASTTGKVYKLRQNYRFNGSTYTLTAITKEDLLGSIELQKDIHKVYVIYEIQSSGTFDFSYRLDNFKTSGGATWITTTVDQTSTGMSEILVGDKGTSIQFKIVSDDLDAKLGIIGFVTLYDYLNLR